MDMLLMGDDVIEEYLALFSFEEILEMNDLTEEEVLRVLWEMGHIDTPPYMDNGGDVGNEKSRS